MRAHLLLKIEDSSGNILAGSQVRLLKPRALPTDTPVALDVPAYADGVSNTQQAMPYQSSNGMVDLWLDLPQYVSIGITPPQASEYIVDNLAAQAPSTGVVVSPVEPANPSVGMIWYGGTSLPQGVPGGSGGGGTVDPETVKTIVEGMFRQGDGISISTDTTADTITISVGTVPVSSLPPIAIVQFLGQVASQTAMLNLVGQRGDWCVRTDTGTNWVLVADDPSSLASWMQYSYPAAPVTSVAGRTGAISLQVSDVTGAAPKESPAFTGTATFGGTALGGAAFKAVTDFAAAQHTHTYADLPPGVTLSMYRTSNGTGDWPTVRITNRTDLTVLWIGVSPKPTDLDAPAAGQPINGFLRNVDVWVEPTSF